MKVILYMAITANGYIAKKNNDTPWSSEEFASYFSHVRSAKHVIVGHKTFKLFRASDFADMGHPLVIILTRKSSLSDKDQVKYVNSPQQALQVLEAKGFMQALVTGGGETNQAFLDQGLIDEIYLDVEPILFGQDIPLFAPTVYDCQLELLGTLKLNPHTLQLHYKVLK